jgi:FHS family glucose/mannose:H+ symporter-like MFS transporter
MNTIAKKDRWLKDSKVPVVMITALSLVMVVRGMMLSIASPVLIEISKSLSTVISNMGLLFGVYNAGFVSGSITSASRFFKKIDNTAMLIFALILQAIFVFIFSISRNFSFALIINFMVGIASGFISSLTSVILAEIGKEREAFYQNIGYMFVSLGAFISPYLSSLVVSRGLTWNLVYQILAVFTLLNIILTTAATRVRSLKSVNRNANTSAPENKEKTEEKMGLKEFRGIFLTVLVLLIFTTLFYISAERGLAIWLPTFLRTQRNIDILYSGQTLSFFWLAIAAGRLITSIASRRFDFIKITIFQGLLGVIVTTLAIFETNRTIVLLLIIAAGICYSSIWPNIIAFASRYFKAGRSSAISMLVATTGIAAILAPWLLGVIYTASSLFISLLCVSLCLLIHTLIFTVIRVIVNKYNY